MSNDSSNKTVPPTVSATPQTGSRAANRGVRWGAVAAIVVTALSIVLAYFVAPTVVYVVASLLGWSTSHISAWSSSTSGAFTLTLLADAVVIGTIIWFLRSRRASVRDVGYHRQPVAKDIGVALLAFVVYFVLLMVASAVAQQLLHVNVDQKQELGFDNVFTTGQKLLTFVSLVCVPPLVEETLFRGFMFTGLRTRLSFAWTTVLVSLIFASLHLIESSQGILWIAGIDTFILSIILCYVREKTGNLWAGIFLHALKNGVAFTFLYLVGSSL